MWVAHLTSSFHSVCIKNLILSNSFTVSVLTVNSQVATRKVQSPNLCSPFTELKMVQITAAIFKTFNPLCNLLSCLFLLDLGNAFAFCFVICVKY
jgi:hypothetical protein